MSKPVNEEVTKRARLIFLINHVKHSILYEVGTLSQVIDLLTMPDVPPLTEEQLLAYSTTMKRNAELRDEDIRIAVEAIYKRRKSKLKAKTNAK